jgi:hypothetical protein
VEGVDRLIGGRVDNVVVGTEVKVQCLDFGRPVPEERELHAGARAAACRAKRFQPRLAAEGRIRARGAACHVCPGIVTLDTEYSVADLEIGAGGMTKKRRLSDSTVDAFRSTVCKSPDVRPGSRVPADRRVARLSDLPCKSARKGAAVIERRRAVQAGEANVGPAC